MLGLLSLGMNTRNKHVLETKDTCTIDGPLLRLLEANAAGIGS
jgi:hypothetical protein